MNKAISFIMATLFATNNFQVGYFGERISESPTIGLLNSGMVEIVTKQKYEDQVEFVLEEEQETEEVMEVVQQDTNEIIVQPTNRINVLFECSFYTTSADECGNSLGIGASGEYVQPWVSIALPPDIPFYSVAYIEELGTFINHDTGSYIQWDYDDCGNLVCRVDICVSTKEEAISLGRFYANGYIEINE